MSSFAAVKRLPSQNREDYYHFLLLNTAATDIMNLVRHFLKAVNFLMLVNLIEIPIFNLDNLTLIILAYTLNVQT